MENNTSDTNNFLNWVEIKNFKSIKDLRLDCKRVNVFIGKPNVGKSNILEGLGLLGADYRVDETKLNDFVRYNSLSNLFYDDDVVDVVTIKADKIAAEVGYNISSKSFYFFAGREKWINKVNSIFNKSNNIFSGEEGVISDDVLALIANQSIQVKSNSHNKNNYHDIEIFRFGGTSSDKLNYGYSSTVTTNPIKRYEFNGVNNISDIGQNYLLPPFGRNLFNVIDHNEEIRKDLAEVFRPDGLNLVLSKKERKFFVQKEVDGYIYTYPYANIADTFQRYAFYLSAIESNKNSVIIFEEPEVHSFAPYTQALTYRMIYSEENQFFVTTHSPYLLQTLIENLSDDQLNVFVTYYEDYETKIHALTSDELLEVMNFSIDIFYNLRRFQPNG